MDGHSKEFPVKEGKIFSDAFLRDGRTDLSPPSTPVMLSDPESAARMRESRNIRECVPRKCPVQGVLTGQSSS